MKKKAFVIALLLLLLLSVTYLAVGMGGSLFIGAILVLVIVLVGIAFQIKSGDDTEPVAETDKLGVKHHSETRPTALGCYGPEAEEEKMIYNEKPPPKKIRQKE